MKLQNWLRDSSSTADTLNTNRVLIILFFKIFELEHEQMSFKVFDYQLQITNKYYWKVFLPNIYSTSEQYTSYD